MHCPCLGYLPTGLVSETGSQREEGSKRNPHLAGRSWDDAELGLGQLSHRLTASEREEYADGGPSSMSLRRENLPARVQFERGFARSFLIPASLRCICALRLPTTGHDTAPGRTGCNAREMEARSSKPRLTGERVILGRGNAATKCCELHYSITLSGRRSNWLSPHPDAEPVIRKTFSCFL